MPKHMISKKGTVSVKNNKLKQGKGVMLKLERHAHHAYDKDTHGHSEEQTKHETNLERLKNSLSNLTLNSSSHKRYVKF